MGPQAKYNVLLYKQEEDVKLKKEMWSIVKKKGFEPLFQIRKKLQGLLQDDFGTNI